MGKKKQKAAKKQIKAATQKKQVNASKGSSFDIKKPVSLYIQLLSPIHLGSGQADVNVDAEIIHDDLGMPYFPARRLKGLLYESGLEIAEMAEASNLNLFTKQEWDELFQHDCIGRGQVDIPNLYLQNSGVMAAEWSYLENKYPEFFRKEDVMESYTTIRYQTKIDDETGTAVDSSLHNMRVLDEGLVFTGELSLQNGDLRSWEMLGLAVRNLTQAGLKRNRGFGRIACTLKQNGGDITGDLVNKALAQAGGDGNK